MKKFFSISQYPGKTGQYFYNCFFEYYKINATYTPIGSSSVIESFNHLKTLNPDGISVSMPFKKDVINLLDFYSSEVSKYECCNTIKFSNSLTTGYNADIKGAIKVSKNIIENDTISILGDGCMSKMFDKYLANFSKKIYSRKLHNWHERHQDSNVIINCTSLGTSTSKSPIEHFGNNTKLVIDLSINDNDLKKLCYENEIKYISGIEFYKYQFIEQFLIYTEIVPDPDYFDYCLKLK